MKINQKKLPLKYFLEIYQEAPGYPSQTDLEYALISSLSDKGLLESEFAVENIWNGMKNHIGTLSELEKFLNGLTLNESNTNVQLTKSGKKYRVTYFPWC